MRVLVALAAAALLALPASSHAAVAQGAYYGQEQHAGCLDAGCGFTVTSDTCAGATITSTNGVMKCRVRISGWIPDPNLDAIYNAYAYIEDGRGTAYPVVPLRYNGASYVGVAAMGLDVVTVAGTLTFSPPSGNLDPPPAVITLTGSLSRA